MNQPAVAGGPARWSARWRARLDDVFGADLRSLALLRVALATIVLCDVGLRARDLEVFYSDSGVLPRAAYLARVGEGWSWSLHLVAGVWWVQAVLFGLTALAAAALLLGWRTRVATIATWLLLCSVQQRNPLLTQGGDILLRVVLFWAMFLPLGARASLDRVRARRERARGGGGGEDEDEDEDEPVRVLSVATVALLVQVVLVYWMTALWKDSAAWRSDGTALYYALQLDQFVTTIGRWLRGYPTAMRVLTLLVFWFEVVGPLLLLSPWRPGVMRTLAIAGFFALHLGVLLCLDIGLFPFISAFVMVGFLPSWFWDRLQRRRSNPPAPTKAPVQLPRWAQLLCAACLAYVAWWNLADLPGSPLGLPDRVRFVGQVLHLEQRWDLFAPAPTRNDGWLELPARLADGTEIDLARGLPRNQRWRRYQMNLVATGNAWYRRFFASYMCRSQPDVVSLELVFMRERTMPEGQAPELTRVSLWKQSAGCARASGR